MMTTFLFPTSTPQVFCRIILPFSFEHLRAKPRTGSRFLPTSSPLSLRLVIQLGRRLSRLLAARSGAVGPRLVRSPRQTAASPTGLHHPHRAIRAARPTHQSPAAPLPFTRCLDHAVDSPKSRNPYPGLQNGLLVSRPKGGWRDQNGGLAKTHRMVILWHIFARPQNDAQNHGHPANLREQVSLRFFPAILANNTTV